MTADPVVSPADTIRHDYVALRSGVSDPADYFQDDEGHYHARDCRGCKIVALLAVGERDTAEISKWQKRAWERATAMEVQGERDRKHIAQLTEALNEMTDAGYEHVMGHDEPGDLASAVQKAARVLSPLSPEWFAAADEILTNLGAVLADKEDAGNGD